MKPNNTTLYHGSYCEVRVPDLTMCRRGKDYGKGFYLTTDREQAIRFTRIAIIKAKADGRISDDITTGYLNAYQIGSDITSLDIHEFESADSEWLHCVASYRKSGMISSEPWERFDIIGGKIANDKTNLVITAYLDGAYGAIGSPTADSMAISLLEPDNLNDQFCFRTEAAINTLTYINSECIEL